MIAAGCSSSRQIPPPAVEAQTPSALYTRAIFLENAHMQNLKLDDTLDQTKPMSVLIVDYLSQKGLNFESPSYARFDAKTHYLLIHGSIAELTKVETLLWELRNSD